MQSSLGIQGDRGAAAELSIETKNDAFIAARS